MTAAKKVDLDQDSICGGHGPLMDTLVRLRTDVSWIKRALWSTPVLIVMISIALAGYIIGIDHRLAACEAQLAAITKTK